jgi:hypothetical protein
MVLVNLSNGEREKLSQFLYPEQTHDLHIESVYPSGIYQWASEDDLTMLNYGVTYDAS